MHPSQTGYDFELQTHTHIKRAQVEIAKTFAKTYNMNLTVLNR